MVNVVWSYNAAAVYYLACSIVLALLMMAYAYKAAQYRKFIGYMKEWQEYADFLEKKKQFQL